MSLPVINWETFIDPFRTSVLPDRALSLSVGVFDGVHRGHQRLITKIRAYAGEHGGLGGVISFRQNPRRLLHPKNYPGDIYGLSQKIRTLEGLGADFVVLIDFSGDFSRMSGKEFAAFLKKRRICYLAVGVNFRCGYHLDTNARLLREMMAEETLTELVPPLKLGGAPVSSSRIRESIRRGDLAAASELLGRPYGLDLSGLVPRPAGDLLSWDLGREGRLLPPGGLYEVFIRSGGADFSAEISLDSGYLTLKRDAGPEGFFAEIQAPPEGGDLSKDAMFTVEFVNSAP